MIFSLTDETYSLVCTDKPYISEESRNMYYFAVSVMNQIYWVLGSVMGSLAGNVVKFDSTGIDFALTALFLTIFLEQWMSAKKHMPAIVGVVAATVCLVVFGSETFLIPTMIIISLVFCFCGEEKKND